VFWDFVLAGAYECTLVNTRVEGVVLNLRMRLTCLLHLNWFETAFIHTGLPWLGVGESQVVELLSFEPSFSGSTGSLGTEAT